jgi:hypothetical protein
MVATVLFNTPGYNQGGGAVAIVTLVTALSFRLLIGFILRLLHRNDDKLRQNGSDLV